MAFGDWESIEDTLSGGNFNASLDIINPILGTGSLRQGDNPVPGTSGGQGVIATQLNNTFTRGLTRGRIRSIVRWDWPVESNGTGFILGGTGPGIYYMCSTLDIANVPGNFYFASLAREDNLAGEVRPIIAKGTNEDLRSLNNSIGPATDKLITTASNITGVTEGDTIAIQIEWNLDIAGLGGLRHTMSVGNIGDTDFSNLTVVYDLVEISPFTVSSVEGIANRHEDNDLATDDAITWDNTGVFQLV